MKATDIATIFQDEDILIVNKPSGITVIPERFDKEKKSLQALLEPSFGKLFVVHRIDRETTGIVCFAKNEAAHKQLSLQFQAHTIDKFYTAIVCGRLEGNEGEIDSPLAENIYKPGTMIVHAKGKPSLTLFNVVAQYRHFALLNVQIKTGRTHQIRVHFATAGHPLMVDKVYGKNEKFMLSQIKKGYKHTQEEETALLSRLSLHASKLGFIHPTTEKHVSFEAQLPKDLQTVIKLLDKYDR